MEVTLKAYQVVEKTAKTAGTSAHVFVPKEWAGKKVRVFLLEEINENNRRQDRQKGGKDKKNSHEPKDQ